MSSESERAIPRNDEPQWFTTTHWSVVLAARAPSPEADRSLQMLCRAYWPPLYTFIRQRGHAEHDAQDLTQEFIARLLAKDFLANVSPQKGRFRSYLLAALKNFLTDEYHRATAAKRGGGAPMIPLASDLEEQFLGAEPATHTTPETDFERCWARALLERAVARLREEWTDAGRAAKFERLKSYLEAEPENGEYAAVARDLKMSSGAVSVAVHRLRARFVELVRREIAHTVATPEEIDDELRHLATVLGRGAV